MTKKERKQQGQRVTIGGVEYACSHMAQDIGPHGNLIKYPAGLVRVSYKEEE